MARRNGPIVIDTPESGALLAWIPYVLCSGDVAHTGKHMLCIGTKEGELQLKTIETLKAVWPSWDGKDPFELENIPTPEGENAEAPEFELADCYHDDSYTPPGSAAPVIQFRARWFNKIGGTQNMPEPMDETGKKKAISRWGSKFKAASGGAAKPATKPAATAAPKAAPAQQELPAAKAAPKVSGPPSRKAPAPPAPKARTSDQQTVWEAYYTAQGGDESTAETLGEQFYAAAEVVAPGVDPTEMTPEQWGATATSLGV